MLDSIQAAIDDIRKGKIVIVVDDEDRENEGDFITAARNVTPEIINFMSKHGRGLICAPLIEERCDELGLEPMVNNIAEHRVVEKFVYLARKAKNDFVNIMVVVKKQ